jgi:hypothetical protein
VTTGVAGNKSKYPVRARLPSVSVPHTELPHCSIRYSRCRGHPRPKRGLAEGQDGPPWESSCHV